MPNTILFISNRQSFLPYAVDTRLNAYGTWVLRKAFPNGSPSSSKVDQFAERVQDGLRQMMTEYQRVGDFGSWNELAFIYMYIGTSWSLGEPYDGVVSLSNLLSHTDDLDASGKAALAMALLGKFQL